MAVYHNITEGIFMERPNRFTARVNICGVEEICHVKNTGRCRELLVPGCRVFLEKAANPGRKTAYDLISVIKETDGRSRIVNMDSQIPNTVAAEWIENGGLGNIPVVLKKEVKYKNSRFDIYGEFIGENQIRKRTFIEVKGVTLEENGIVRFPDAPTLRGLKHIHELIECRKNGFDAYIIFIIQMADVKYFTPNYDTQPEFGEALKIAQAEGVKIAALECLVERNSITAAGQVKILL